MRILVNYQSSDQGYLSMLAYLLKQENLEAVSTKQALTFTELQAKAKLGKADAIMICNQATLANIAPSTSPSLDEYRGSRLNFSIPIIITNPLEHLKTVPHGEWLLKKDLAKFHTIHKPATDFTFIVLRTIDDFISAYNTLKQCHLISYDIETDIINAPAKDSLDTKAGTSVITCCSWTGLQSTGTLVTYVLPFINFKEPYWANPADYGKALQLLQAVNALPIPKVMQNGSYDSIHSIRYRAFPSYYCLDTLGLAHSEFQELPKDLSFIASYQLYDYVQWKFGADQAKKQKNIEEYWAYNAKDSWYTMRICIEQLKSMPAHARKNYSMQFPNTYPFLYCAMEGMLLDNTKRLDLRNAAEKKLKESLAVLQTMTANPNFNPGSWQQVEKYIYNIFGAKKPKIGKSKSCTDEKNLQAVAEQHPLLNRITDHILIYRGEQKAIGTYFDFLQINNRLLYSLDPFGAETGRASCRASAFWAGTQMQNIPYYAKSMMIADEGYELFEVDNNKSEARCSGYLAQEEALIRVVEDAEKDFYKVLGTMFFNIPYEEVTDFFRNKVLKRINHGTTYMMGDNTFIINIGMKILRDAAVKLGYILTTHPRTSVTNELTPKKFAGMLLEVYHIPFKRIRMWYKEVYNEVLTTHYIASPSGYKRFFFGDISKNHNILRGAVAHGPQHLSVHILNTGLMRVYKELVLPGNGNLRIKAQVHDSILGQWKIEMRDFYKTEIEKRLDNPITVHGRVLRIPVEFKAGPSWGTMKGLT